MLVTLLGMATLVRLLLPRNASYLMLTTLRPLIELGMVTAPPGPVYPVIVQVPLPLLVQCPLSSFNYVFRGAREPV
jgi:hypothetical protein